MLSQPGAAATTWRDRRFTLSRVGLAGLSSLALCIVLMTQVAVGFHAVRVKLVRSPRPPSDGVVRVDTALGQTKSLTAPVAIIARIRNDSPSGGRFDIVVDGQPVCSHEVRSGTTQRVDCVLIGRWDPGLPHAIEVGTARRIPWTLAYLELATHYGSTQGFDLIIVPAVAQRHERPQIPTLVLSFLLVAAAFMVPSRVMPRWTRRAHAGLSIVTAAFLLLVFLSPRLSSYSLLISGTLFAELTLLLLAPRVWFGVEWLAGKRSTAWARALICLAVGLVVVLAYGGVVRRLMTTMYGGNYSGLIQLSGATYSRHPVLSGRDDVRRTLALRNDGGYDGQFMYYIAFDPFLRAYAQDPGTYSRFIDAPPYRYGRIGFSLLTRVLSGGQWSRYPQTMVWLILAALLGCGVTLAMLAQSAGASPAWGLLVIVVPGFWQSVACTLPEPLAAMFLLAGWLLLNRGHALYGAILFAASLLVRETGAVLVVISAGALFVNGRRRDGISVLAVSLAPLLLWRLYVGWALSPHWGAQAFVFNAHNIGVPFLGIAELWRTIAQGSYYREAPTIAQAGMLYPALLGFGLVVALAAAIRKPGPATIASVVYGIIAVSFTYDSIWVHVGNAQRGTYELFICSALVLLGVRRSDRGLTWALAAFWAAAALYVFVGGLDAQFIRETIF